ncbi:hypothetical protein N7U49_07570 [Streptomyces sp. AD2-2]|nr:hypothetical protein N7U49_07570 [Streptomyces sp. AD2-2]
MDAALGQALPALTALRDQGVIGAVMAAGRWTLLDRTARPCWTCAPNAGSRWWPPHLSTPVRSAVLAPRATPPSTTAPPRNRHCVALGSSPRCPPDTAPRSRTPPRAFRCAIPGACVVAGFRTPEEVVSAAR